MEHFFPYPTNKRLHALQIRILKVGFLYYRVRMRRRSEVRTGTNLEIVIDRVAGPQLILDVEPALLSFLEDF